jgi:hypothetical protein
MVCRLDRVVVMGDGKGYLIPDNAQPDNLRCVRVYIPDDQLYLAVLIGSLSYLGTWAAWERDSLKRGSLAAQAWKDANERTFDEMHLSCGCDEPECEICEMTEEELRSLISQELKKMSIVINNNTGCGCGCDQTTIIDNDGDAPIQIRPDDSGVNPPYSQEPVVTTDSNRCRAANYLADRAAFMMRSIGQFGDGANTVAAIVALLGTIITWLSPIPGDEIIATSALVVIAYQIVNALRSAEDFGFQRFEDLADDIENNMQELVCLLVDYGDASALGNSLQAWINDKIDDIASETGMSFATSSAMKAVVNGLLGSGAINKFVDSIGTVVPASFVPRYDCGCVFDIPQPADERIVVVPANNMTVESGQPPSIVSIQGNRLAAYGDGSQLSYSAEIGVDEAEYVPLGGQFVGMVYYIRQQSSDDDARYDHEIRNVVDNVNIFSMTTGFTYGVRELAHTDQYILDYFAEFDSERTGADIDDAFIMYTQDSMNQPNSAGFAVDVYYVYIVP